MTVYYEDLKAGQSASMTRTVTEHDVQLFGEATGDMNPVHFDDAYARRTVFRGRVAHGVLSIGFMSAVMGNELPGAGCIFISATTNFKGPVRIGDTVVTTVSVKEVLENRKVMMSCRCEVDGKLVVEGEALVLAPKKTHFHFRLSLMRIFRHFEDVPQSLKGSVAAIGNFDGVHRGHQALIAQAKWQARTLGCPMTVMAFEPHPQEYFRPGPASIRLTPLRMKARLLAEQEVDAMFALPFDAAMAGRTADQFVQDVLKNGLGVAGVVVGPDFEFGKGRGGNLTTLRASGGAEGFTVTGFEMVRSGAEKISSTRIRDLLAAARPEEAARLLGRYWAVEARVEHGDKRGRTMGFPTANMHLGHCFAPAFGVYAVRVIITDNEREVDRRDGVANFGIRPMYQTKVPLMEAHLFDFDGDLYGKHLQVELVSYIRPEAKFEGLPALIAQIGRDAARARDILAVTPPTPALDAR